MLNLRSSKTKINPTINIGNRKGDNKAEVLINGKQINVRTAKVGTSLLVWIPATINEETNIIIH
jgi:hypothetical protein